VCARKEGDVDARRLFVVRVFFLLKNVAEEFSKIRDDVFSMYVYICIYDKRQRELEIEKTNEQREEYTSEEREDEAISQARSA
jgi:hypothetical protein